MPHYADGTPAKHGDLAVRQNSWDKSEVIGIITSITPSESCNAYMIPLASCQVGSPWFPSGNQPVWTVTLKECMKVNNPAFPPT